MNGKKDGFLDYSASQYEGKIIKGWERLYHRKSRFLYGKIRSATRGTVVLEMGCADGEMTQWLAADYPDLTVVDGSELFLLEVSSRIPGSHVRYEHALFEEYSPLRKFDLIIMTHILEHLDDPVQVLKRTKQWLMDNGRVFVSVPNANSIHRLVGVKMGLLERSDSLNEQDILLGHRRVYTPELLRTHIGEAGFEIEQSGGCMVKPLSNRQIEESWSDELIDAFFALGEDFPELCSEIYAVIRVPHRNDGEIT